MNGVQVFVSDFGLIDISKFSHLKFRKDGWLDGRRSKEYYRELLEYIDEAEKKIVDECVKAYNDAKIELSSDCHV